MLLLIPNDFQYLKGNTGQMETGSNLQIVSTLEQNYMRVNSKNTFWHVIQHRKVCALHHWFLVICFTTVGASCMPVMWHNSDSCRSKSLRPYCIGERILCRCLLTEALSSSSSSVFQNKKVWKALRENLLRPFLGKTVLCTTHPAYF